MSYISLNKLKTFYSELKNVFALKSAVPITLADLTDDSTHRLTTDTEKTTWNAKQDALSTVDKQAIADLHKDAVTSVNGQTGAVTISVPTKTSDLTNDSGFITENGIYKCWVNDTSVGAEILTAIDSRKLVIAQKSVEGIITYVLTSYTATYDDPMTMNPSEYTFTFNSLANETISTITAKYTVSSATTSWTSATNTAVLGTDRLKGSTSTATSYDSNIYTALATDNLLANKVSTEEGKGLSSNDYTDTEKTKLANLGSVSNLNYTWDADTGTLAFTTT